MPRFSIPISSRRSERVAPPDRYGRQVRYVNGVERAGSEHRLIDPLFIKLALGLAIIATLAVAGGLWRVSGFHH